MTVYIRNAWQWICQKCNIKNPQENQHCWKCGRKRRS